MSKIGDAYEVDENKVCPDGDQEHEEQVMVAHADAVVKPLAVVIKSVYALVANVAVP